MITRGCDGRRCRNEGRWGHGSSTGFSLIELMLVVAIVGVLTSIMVPMFEQFRCSAKTSEAKALLRAIANAHHIYFNEHQTFPMYLEQLELGMPDDQIVNNRVYGRYYEFTVVFNWIDTVFAAIATGYEEEQGWYYILYSGFYNDDRDHQLMTGEAACQTL